MTRLIELVLGAVFAVAAAAKISSTAAPDSGTILGGLGHNARWLFVAAECALAIWFLLSRRLVIGSIVATMFLSCVTAALISELTKPVPRDCGCFGHAASSNDPQRARQSLQWGIARNLALAAGCGFVAFSRPNGEEKRIAI